MNDDASGEADQRSQKYVRFNVSFHTLMQTSEMTEDT